MLGAEQSGHIAAVGFDLYCQLLNRTIARLKGEAERPIIEVAVHFDFLDLTPDPEREENAAVIPRKYIEDESQRIGLYRKVAGLSFEQEVDALAAEFRDRFGPLPGPVRRLLAVSRLRIAGGGARAEEPGHGWRPAAAGQGAGRVLDGERSARPPAPAWGGRAPGGDRETAAATAGVEDRPGERRALRRPFDQSNTVRMDWPMAWASSGGTALPIWRFFCAREPMKRYPSGKLCNRAPSRVVRPRLTFG
jgi:hypothetical protein